jgi:hypothetical protein
VWQFNVGRYHLFSNYSHNRVCFPKGISIFADMQRAVSRERKAPESLDVNGGSGEPGLEWSAGM